MTSRAKLDEIAPSYIGERRIALSLSEDSEVLANQSFLVDADYSAAEPQGVTLPLVLTVQGPSPESYQRRVYYRSRPAQIALTLREGGEHLITLAEPSHNRWHGAIRVQVAGEQVGD